MDVQREAGPRPAGSRLDELESLLEQTAALAEMAITPAAFSPRLLEAAARAAAATGAGLWVAGSDGQWREESATGTTAVGVELRSAFAKLAAEKRRILAVPPGGRVEPDGLVNASPGWLLFAPAPPGRVLELSLPSDVGSDRRLLTEVARSFAELAGDFFERQELATLRYRAAKWRRLEAFVVAVHRPLDILPTAYAIANDGRLVAGCDRLSVAVGRRGRVLAVSGVERPDRRADAVSHIERVAAAAVRTGESHWRLTGETAEPLPKHLARAWNEYRSAVGPATLDIVLLRDLHSRRGRPTGALIGEWFGNESEPSDGLEAICVHAETALANALRATPGPMGLLLRKVAAPARVRNLPTTLLTIAALIAVAAALSLWQTDFTVDARGRLRPADQRDVFASRDGIVRELNVRHGQTIEAGEELLVLADPTLDFNLEQVLGDLRTTRQRLISIQAARTTGPASERAGDRAAGRSGQLAGEEKELTERLGGLERQLAILERERDALRVVSPIDGVVLTWEASERLESRPVRRGQRLLTVARPDGDWLLELFVPDRRVGHVLDAQAASRPDLQIDFLLATDPTVTHHEAIESIALSAEPHESDESSVRITARLAPSALHDPRPGATVVAKIHCGERPIGYVWFQDVIEAIQTHVLF